MIITILLNIVYAFVLAIIALFALLGEVSTESSVTQGIATISSYLSPLNSFLPIDTLLQILAFEVVLETAYLGYKAIKWTYSKIPGIN